MVNTPRITEGSPRHRGLLFSHQQFEVCAYLPEQGGECALVRIPGANTYEIGPAGDLEFFHVVDDVWHPIQVFSASQWLTLHPVDVAERDEEPPVTYEEFENLRQRLIDHDRVTASLDEQSEDSVQEIKPEDLTGEAPSDPVERQAWYDELRQGIKDDLRAGKFPEDGGPHHKQLQDIWEGKGDPDADAFGLVTRAHDETVPHEEKLEDLEDENRAYWPTGASPDEINRWLAERHRDHEKKLAELRAEADEARQEWERNQPPSLPAHLNPMVPNPENHPGLPVPPYSDTNPVYTTLVGSDGTLPTLTDRDGERVEPPAVIKAYAEKVAAEPNPYLTTTTPGGIPRTPTPEEVEDWHGKVSGGS